MGQIFILSCFLYQLEVIKINSMISISVTHAFKTKANLDVIDNNSYAL
jgi:hypothetical protein